MPMMLKIVFPLWMNDGMWEYAVIVIAFLWSFPLTSRRHPLGSHMGHVTPNFLTGAPRRHVSFSFPYWSTSAQVFCLALVWRLGLLWYCIPPLFSWGICHMGWH
jgi:hypothetical protein